MSEERDALRATATEFVRREVVPHLQEWEDAGEIPRALHRTAGDLGLIGVAFPEEVGGGGGDLVDSLVVHGLLGQGVAASTRFDPQAKGLGEWLRSRVVSIEDSLL